MDMNDRSLRSIIVGLNKQGFPRETGFDITPASEIMACLCLATSYKDMEERINRIVIGFTTDDKPVFARELGITGSVMALLKDALMPNLVQSVEGVPCFLHGGPFANIAHGCNSVLAIWTLPPTTNAPLWSPSTNSLTTPGKNWTLS